MPDKVLAGMLIGQVYRLKVANLVGNEGQEIFPTIEVIDRLYPPPGQEARFPIPIELTAEELATVNGGVRNADTQAYHAFLGGLVQGFLDAGGGVSISFSPTP